MPPLSFTEMERHQLGGRLINRPGFPLEDGVMRRAGTSTVIHSAATLEFMICLRA